MLTCRLKSTLAALSAWSKSKIGNFKYKIAELEQKLQTLSERVDWELNLDIPEQESITETRQELEFYYDCEMSYWNQRARISWHLEGERNTKYFHSMATNRKNKNLVTSIKNENGEWTSDFEEITGLAFQHFSGILQADNRLSHEEIHVELENLLMPSIFDRQAANTLSPLQPSEIRDAVFSLPKDSAPGPDGYHASFFQKNWTLVSKDVTAMVTSIWTSGRILKEMNKTNVVLIPKKASSFFVSRSEADQFKQCNI